MQADFTSGVATITGRCITAEIRAQLAAQRASASWLAAEIGVSQSYISRRLRDEAPFTIDEIELISRVLFEEDALWLTKRAIDNHSDAVDAASYQ